MLITFSIENYRSFREEQTLNLLASKRLGKGSIGQVRSLPEIDEDILTTVALYGANGAGKSNLVSAVRFVERLVLFGTEPGERIPYRPFIFDESTPSQPMTFDMQLLAGGSVFRYGFSCDDKTVHEEWLGVYDGKKERQLFNRNTGADGAVEVKLPSQSLLSDAKKIKALAEVGARPNQLFLTEIVNLDDPKAQGSLLRQLVEWFAETLHVVLPDFPVSILFKLVAEDASFATFASQFLRGANTGISNLSVQTEIAPKSQWERMQKLAKHLFGEGAREKEFRIGSDEGELFVDVDDNDTVKIRRISTEHGEYTLPLFEESDGSKRLLNLLPLLYKMKEKGAVIIIDELERSLHPMLAHKFIEFFHQSLESAPGQLVFTTHETTLLDPDLLRRDSIWFTEKDQVGASSLYSLSDFKVRKDLKLRKHYLQGRFGAVPFLGGIDRLIEEEMVPETAS
jgi:AAA15 family ATPase/GTPase